MMVLTVVLANTYDTMIAISYENEHRPYKKRAVQIELTPEQEALIRPRVLGNNGGVEFREEVLECWLEPPKEEE